MSAQQLLRDEISATRSSIRRYAEAGKSYEADLAAARCYGLLRAAELLGMELSACTHPTHTTAGLDEKGKTIWVCTRCGETA